MSDLDITFDHESDLFLASPFYAVYDGLMREGYSHNIALWGAWSAIPSRHERERVGLPVTQREFAEEVLGVRPRTVRGYRTRHPQIESLTRRYILDSVLGKYRRPALEAMGQSASQIDGRHSRGDRDMLFRMTGDLPQSHGRGDDDALEAEPSPLPDALEAALARAYGNGGDDA
jgi:hypothetical protein